MRKASALPACFTTRMRNLTMPSILLWLLGVPLSAIILLNLFGIL